MCYYCETVLHYVASFMKPLKSLSTYLLPVIATTAAMLHSPFAAQSSLQLAQSAQGKVEGTIQFPSDYVPAMRVCGQKTSNSYLMSCINTEEAQSTFSIDLDPGEYYLFSFMENGFVGGRDAFYFHSIGGFQGGSNAPAPVQVTAGQTTGGVVLNNYQTCGEYPQYCVAPPSASSVISESVPSDSEITQLLITGENWLWGGVESCNNAKIVFDSNGSYAAFQRDSSGWYNAASVYESTFSVKNSALTLVDGRGEPTYSPATYDITAASESRIDMVRPSGESLTLFNCPS